MIRPLALLTDGAAWYLEAWCALAGARRTFRVDRFLRIAPAAGEPPEDGEGTPGEEGPAEQPATAVVLVLDKAARWLAEDIPGATIRDVSHEGAPCIEVRIELTRTDWLVRQLLPLGDQVRAVAPAAVRDELVARARAALAAYEAWPPEGEGTPDHVH